MLMQDYLQKLNSVQYEAVISQGQPLLILAGAGSGKTRVITSKIAYLIQECGISPYSILAVTFTNKAAGEMRQRVADFLGYSGDMNSHDMPMIRTFHSFGAWLLRRNAEFAGLSPDFTIYDDSDMQSLLKSVCRGTLKDNIRMYANLISRAKDYCLLPEDDLDIVSYDPELSSVYKDYQNRLSEIGNVDFGDLILRPVVLLRENSDIRERLARRFSIILVDEYQDSNIAQFELLKLLAGDGRGLTVVGDDDQSIYKFRGAEVKNIIGFPEYFANTRVIRLEENYRSTSPILDIAGAVVDNNEGRLGKKLWTSRKGGKKPELHVFNTAEDEAEFCARLVQKDDMETAILYRTNAQSHTFETVFTRHNIPYRIVGSLRFYEREEVKDILAWLCFIMNPKDEIAFMRIINKPARGIGKAALEKISAADGADFLERLDAVMSTAKGKSHAGMEEFRTIYREIVSELDNEEKTLADFIEAISSRSGLGDFFHQEDLTADTYKVDNIKELSNGGKDMPCTRGGIAAFLENIELDSSAAKETDENDSRVVFITMHNTKGLEFDRVIVTGLEDELFPGRGGEDKEEVEEERRIFYVSITRARDELYLTCCSRRMIWGRSQFCTPSRFLKEIPEDLVKADGASMNKTVSCQLPYHVGECLYHDDYGAGIVIKSWMQENEPMVMIRFETGRILKFLTNYTGFDRISQW
ncbi:MAG: UvrD-helicase domain-containing protein [Spirochaetia bacterium]|nr:UvrD-helicase domain-containing protein [Spirochaetia bacterium]